MDVLSRLLLDIQDEYGIPSSVLLLVIGVFFLLWMYYKHKRDTSNGKSQKITAGDKSNNIQMNDGHYIDNSNGIDSTSGADTYNFQGSIIHVGASEDAIKALCRELIADNFTKLRDEALQNVNARIDEFITLFLPIVDINNSLHVKNLKSPSMQIAIYLAQRAYVVNSDVESGFLIDLLKEKLNTKDNLFKQILLSEAIAKVELLTQKHLEILKVLNEIHNMFPNKRNLDEVVCYYERIIDEFDKLAVNYSDISHLLYTNCVVTYGAVIFPFSNIFKRALTMNNTEFDIANLSDSDLRQIIDTNSRLKKVEDSWNNNNLSSLLLTSVGRVVALAKWNSDYPTKEFDYDEII